MKILYVIPHYYPATDFGGPVVALHELGKELLSLGHDITVYTTDVYTKKRRVTTAQNIIDGIKIHYFPNISNTLAFIYNGYFAPNFAKNYKDSIDSFDLVHIHEFYSILNFQAAYYAAKFGIPVVLSAHGSFTKSSFRGKNILKNIFLSIFGNQMLNKVNHFIALSDREFYQYKKFGIKDNRISIIPNGVSQVLKVKNNLGEKLITKLRIPKNHKIILFVGRLHKVKNLELLIDAFIEVHKKDEKIKLIIAGPDAGEEKYLKEYAKGHDKFDSTIFTGFVNEQEKEALYEMADVFAMTSHFEGLPTAALEASSHGLPLILTTSCSIKEIMEYSAGFIVKEDSKIIADKIDYLLKREKTRKLIGRNGQRMIKQKFSWKIIVSKYIDLYNSLLKK